MPTTVQKKNSEFIKLEKEYLEFKKQFDRLKQLQLQQTSQQQTTQQQPSSKEFIWEYGREGSLYQYRPKKLPPLPTTRDTIKKEIKTSVKAKEWRVPSALLNSESRPLTPHPVKPAVSVSTETMMEQQKEEVKESKTTEMPQMNAQILKFSSSLSYLERLMLNKNKEIRE